MISIGMIGCGTVVHRNYAKTLIARDGYKVEYVFDLNDQQADSAAALFDARRVSLDELVSKADAVIISTPPSSHAELVRASLKPGRTILCEKPFTTSASEAQALSDEASAAGASLYVGHFRRAFPSLELARDLVALGVIGEIQSIEASEGGRFTWPAVSSYPVRDPSGGVIWDTGSHTIDMALFAANLDADPELDVTDAAVTKERSEPSHDFRAKFSLRGTVLAEPVRVSVHVSRKEALPNRLRIKGSRGEIAFITELDNRVRLRTNTGSTILLHERSHQDLMECVDLQVQRILLKRGDEAFHASRFVGQVRVLEALANA